jgi:thiamine biosynthesis lipoprotein
MVYAESEDHGLEACAKSLAVLRDLESKLSVFDDASELSEVNRRAGKRSLYVSAELDYAVSMAEGFRRFTDGAFNAAVEPLMRVWGFHRARRVMPAAIELAAARKSVATAKVLCDKRTVWLPNSHTKLDLGGIGVGLGIDAMVYHLWFAGIRSAFIDISGDCFALGTPPDEPGGWPVRIAGREATVRLRNQAIATSSNSTSVIELEQRVLGHIMDPERGVPVDTHRQVTVVASKAMDADALSTASLVSGQRYQLSSAVWTQFTG